MDKTKLRKIIVGVLMVVVVLGYDISPIDIIPDIVVGVGQIDDIIVTALGIIGTISNFMIGKSKSMEDKDSE